MANTALSSPAAALADVGRFGEIRSRLLFLVGALVVYRIGTFIPVPGINPAAVARFFNDQSNTILGIVNTFSGGALQRLSIFAMGVMPYISASIIIQMLSMVVPSLMEARKEGESGRRRITQLTRYCDRRAGAVPVLRRRGRAAERRHDHDHGFPVAVRRHHHDDDRHHVPDVAGRADHRARRRQRHLDDHPVGHRRAGCPAAIGRTFESVSSGEMNPLFAILLIGIVIGVTGFCVFMERAQRRITVNYAKRQVGRRMYAGQSSHLPFKLNMSGVIPPIFASSLLLFPATMASFFGSNPDSKLERGAAEHRHLAGLRPAAAPGAVRMR